MVGELFLCVHLAFIGMFVASDVDGMSRRHWAGSQRLNLLKPGALRGFILTMILVGASSGLLIFLWLGRHGHDPNQLRVMVAAPAFVALRNHLRLSEETVGLYDLFPLASHLDAGVRKVAGQFLAAEAIWTLEDQGQLGGVPLNVKLDLPGGWDHAPQAVHGRLVDAGALELTDEGIRTFKAVKGAWDRT